ncbi:MAG: 16S rRNA (cytosine(1402)-N(4))-methyltransferase RsmH [Oscillospiraceae bacterium]|nr:16S rRNA (cytosine(1402)-N(4))-methyltransferase RsmH [Candidatus Equicaccousia limihippi]
MEFSHISVLLNEAVDSLNIKSDGIYVDGTAGGAGHSREIAAKLKEGTLYAFDRDPDAASVAAERLKGYNAIVVNENYINFDSVLTARGIDKIDGLLLDLGVSSYQIDNAERGFSFHGNAPLDMRMSKSGASAADIVNNYDAAALCEIFQKYGEEKFAYKIANEIVKRRPIYATGELAQLISDVVPAKFKRDGHPARKCFQALRIAVNGELDDTAGVLEKAFKRLNVGGRIAVITFHSLEDRIVKQTFNRFCEGCTCPPDFPVCVCGKKPLGKLVNKKPIIPSAQEIENNPRSRSAKLRVIEKIREDQTVE